VSYGKIWRLAEAPLALLQQLRNTPQQERPSRELARRRHRGGWRAAANLPRALLAETGRRSRHRRLADVPQLLNVNSFMRSKVEPMVRGQPAGVYAWA
jgi:hypothetical protein